MFVSKLRFGSTCSRFQLSPQNLAFHLTPSRISAFKGFPSCRSLSTVVYRNPQEAPLRDWRTLPILKANAMKRCKLFSELEKPNRDECQLVSDFVFQRNKPAIFREFKHLVRCEWTPKSRQGQGDLVFSNDEMNRFLVVEAKAIHKHDKKARQKRKKTRRQSRYYKACLEDELDEDQIVFAGILTEPRGGFQFLDEAERDEYLEVN